MNDPYVKLAQREGYRARAAYKLKEIDETLRLVKPGAGGGRPGRHARRLEPVPAAQAGQHGQHLCARPAHRTSNPVEGVSFLQGDFRDEAVMQQLEALLAGRPVDLVVSDLAPNLSGIPSSDAARISHLVELAVDFATRHLRPEGALVCKALPRQRLQPAGAELFKQHFKVVKPIKPKASRDKSAETFLVGIGLKVKAAQ
jgi:23S rRNA (uridine2552-2'-O)-methyltransferase